MAAKTSSLEELKKKFYNVGSRLRWFDGPIDVILKKINREIQAKELSIVKREDTLDSDSSVEDNYVSLPSSLQNDSENNSEIVEFSPIKADSNDIKSIDDGQLTDSLNCQQEDECDKNAHLLENNSDKIDITSHDSSASPFVMPTKSLRERVLQKYDPERSCGNDSDDLDSFLDKVRTPKPLCWDDSTEDNPSSKMDDFIVDDDDCFIEEQDQNDFEEVFVEDDSDDDKENFTTPLPFRTPGQKSKTPHTTSSKFLQTPLSARKTQAKTGDKPRRPLSAIESITTPYSNQNVFKKNKDMLIKELFQLYNSTVFENKLPSDMSITWNKKMRSTAGFCYYGRKNGVTTARIELADKVIDSSDRLRDTLIHEMCHGAAWLINNVRAGHGPVWKKWAMRANFIHHDLPPISRCHSYKINAKFIYRCTNEFCSNSIGRHSKSLDLEKYRCAHCHSRFELQPQLKKDGTPQTARTPNKFALFVKDNYHKVKKTGMQHKDVMKELSSQFSALSTK